MRRFAKVDDNQPEIVKFFRDLGWTVAHTHMVGKGFVDIIVAKNGVNVLVEIKDEKKPPSARKLTPDEQKFHEEWKGLIRIIESRQDVIDLDAYINLLVSV